MDGRTDVLVKFIYGWKDGRTYGQMEDSLIMDGWVCGRVEF